LCYGVVESYSNGTQLLSTGDRSKVSTFAHAFFYTVAQILARLRRKGIFFKGIFNKNLCYEVVESLFNSTQLLPTDDRSTMSTFGNALYLRRSTNSC
jgi:hypothetical protein